MSLRRTLNSDFWTDPWVVDHLDRDSRQLFLYLISNSHTTLAGVYEISLRTIGNEADFDKKELMDSLEKLRPKIRYIDGWIVIANFIRHQNYRSPQVQTAIEQTLRNCPQEIIEFVNWPEDYGKQKPTPTPQQRLILDDLSNFSASKTVEKKATVEKSNVAFFSTTSRGRYGMDTVSLAVSCKPLALETAVIKNHSDKTAGLKIFEGNKFQEINLLYDDLSGLVNHRLRAWYCGVFFKLGREVVMRLASEAKSDGSDAKKLFSHLLKQALIENGKRAPIKQTG